MIAEYDIDLIRGDTLDFTMTIEGDIGTVQYVFMTVRRQATDEILFILSNDEGGGITATTDGWAFHAGTSKTNGAPVGLYKYDVKLEMVHGDGVDSDTYTVLHGTFRLHEEQTRAVGS